MLCRTVFSAAALLITPAIAMADATIAGPYQADMGHHVLIVMDIIADGHWSSQTIQDDKVVAEIAGTYQQEATTATTGTVIFTPTSAKTTAEHGPAKVETDNYTIQDNGNVLCLDTGGETMDFKKQPYASK